MKNVLFLGLLLATNCALAQRSDYILVYKITPEQAIELASADFYQKTPPDLLSELGEPMDTISNPSAVTDLPNGCYFYLSAERNRQVQVVEAVADFGIVPSFQKNWLEFQLMDKNGDTFRAEGVWLGDQLVKFDLQKGVYRKKLKKKELLIVQHQGMVVFFEILPKDDGGWWVRTWENVTDWYVWRRPWQLFSRTWYRIQRLFLPSRKPNAYGYLTTNQPKYLPLDTVKIKAFLTKTNGTPYDKPLTLKIHNYAKFNFQTKIQPTNEGSYIFEFPLGDSLELDRNYNIEFWDGRRQLMSNYFTYADYQLDEVTYKLWSEKTTFRSHEPVVVYVSAFNANGLPALDASFELTALAYNSRRFYEATALLPDTLGRAKGSFDERGTFRFVLPKTAIPNADFSARIAANFTNSNGELQSQQLFLTFEGDSAEVVARLEGDELVAEYRSNGRSVRAEGRLIFAVSQSNFRVEKVVSFPYRGRLNPVFDEITVEANHRSVTLKNSYQSPLVQSPEFLVQRSTDSAAVVGLNPNGLEIRYEIYRNHRKVASGESRQKRIVWKEKERKKSSYRVDYQYIMNGKIERSSKVFNYATNQLLVEIDQPSVVSPGETVDLKIRVKNYKNTGEAGVNLAIGAVNRQMTEGVRWVYQAPFVGKQLRPKAERDRYEGANFEMERIDFFDWVGKISLETRQKLQLHRLLYYQLLFPENGYFQQALPYRTDHAAVAEFTPFVVKNGDFQPIYLVYANRRLRYFHATQTPYSVKGESGYNEIVLRGLDFELRLDSVWLERGRKLLLSVDLNHLPPNARLTAAPAQWTPAEKALLSQGVFRYRLRQGDAPHQVFVAQGDDFYAAWVGNSADFGLFQSDKTLDFTRLDGFQTSFKFEPNFIYEVEKNRERLYDYNPFPTDRPVSLSHFNALDRLHDWTLTQADVRLYSPLEPLIKRTLKAAFAQKYSENSGKMNYQTTQADSSLIAWVWVQEATQKVTIFNGGTLIFRNLPTGKHRLYGYTHWGNFFQKEILIRKDTLLFEKLQNVDYQIDTNLNLLKMILNLKEITPTKDLQLGGVSPLSNDEIVLSGQTFEVSGRVTDENGDPIIGATVFLKGTKMGTTTDLDGNYRLQIPTEYRHKSLIINHIGYNSIERSVVSAGNFDFSLATGISLLDEVVVVAFYSSHHRKQVEMTLEVEESVSAAKPTAALKLENSPAPPPIAPMSNVRSHFRDYAFWQPNLLTDRNGEAKLRVTYPDDITGWTVFAIGMGKQKRLGLTQTFVAAQKNALAQLAVPRFLVQGDAVDIIGKALNYGADSLLVQSSFYLNDNLLKINDLRFKNSFIETARVVAFNDFDTLHLTYQMENSALSDGEQRPIPIYKKGVELSEGVFLNLANGDTTLQIGFDAAKGNVQIYAQTDALEVLLNDVKYLAEYPYGCNEQTASRLQALLMERAIHRALGKPLPSEQPILKMVKRLEKAQNPDGSWGWWAGGATNFWMTNYVLKALYAADTSGFRSASYEAGLRYVTNRLEKMQSNDLLNALELLSDLRQNMDYRPYLAALEKPITDVYGRLVLVKIQQQQGLPTDWTLLNQLEKQTLMGNVFYAKTEAQPDWNWYQNEDNLTVLAYQILKKSGTRVAQLPKIVGYFLEKRTRRGWQNTFTTAQILTTILPDLVQQRTLEPAALVVKGNTTEVVQKFPFQTIFYPNRPLEIEKKGGGTVYFTAFQTFWDATPTPRKYPFEVETALFQKGKKVNHLETKSPAELKVKVEIKRSAEFVLVEVPIPAGCSYSEEEKGEGRHYLEVHREYFRNRVAVFFERLPVGTHEFYIALEPRFTGRFTLNPAHVEQMYFPIFYGQNELGRVEIE